MREIKRHALTNVSKPTQDKRTGTTLAKRDAISLLAYTPLPPFDIENAYTNKQNPTYRKQEVLCQCMNALESTPKRKLKVRVRVSVRQSQRKRGKNNSFPTIVPGTPEQDDKNGTPPQTRKQEKDPDPDLTIYYKLLSRYKPECGESNAESVARTEAFQAEYEYRLLQNNNKTIKRKRGRKRTTNVHSLSPTTPTQQTVKFTKEALKRTSTLQIQDDEGTPYLNSVQDIPLDTDYYLYQTQDKPIYNNHISLIYDTGAAISMLPADYAHAWTNLRECLHTLTGCFSGRSESNLMIGEFHGILTLDSQETIRVIIPECIQVPKGLSNTYLLSDSAFLMAGHTYVSHLSKPKLKLKGGGNIHYVSHTRTQIAQCSTNQRK